MRVTGVPRLAQPRRAWAVLALAVVVTAAVLAALVARGGPDEEPRGGAGGSGAAAPAEPVLADLAGLSLPRGPFCETVDDASVEAALGAPAASARSWVNGDTVQLTPEVSDVAHESGCAWVSPTGVEAQAWVFSPRVAPARAARLAEQAVTAQGCASTVGADPTPYGEPGVATTCTVTGGVEVGRRGLFGEAWLTCTVRQPADDPGLVARVDAWCTRVALAAQQAAPS